MVDGLDMVDQEDGEEEEDGAEHVIVMPLQSSLV